MGNDALAALPASEWNEAKARHLLSRAGFGVPRERLEHLARLHPQGAVDFLVDYEKMPDAFPEPDFVYAVENAAPPRQELRDMDREDRREIYRHLRRANYMAVRGLRMWWTERMLKTHRPLEEKMTLFWHGHFATSAQKVRQAVFNYELNQLFREQATGNFKDLALQVGQSRAMLLYLDNRRNVKRQPNENWARELMELFTLGAGNYTEDDIKESARAFTGWTYDNTGFYYDLNVHDFGEKTFLGRRGNFDGWDIINIIFEQPAAAEFICGKLWRYFASEKPNPAAITGMAETLRAKNYDVKPVLRQLFLSRAFYADDVMGSQIKSPVQFVVQLVDDLELEQPPYEAMMNIMAELGQNLFAPPNVAGWEGGRAWINANALLRRYNTPRRMVGASRQPGAGEGFRKIVRQPLMQVEYMTPDGEEKIDMAMMDSMGPMGPVETDSLEMPEWTPKGVFRTLNFATAEQCIDELAARYLSVTLDTDRKEVLKKSLGIEGSLSQPVNINSLQQRDMFATLRLLLSMAEYQLC